MLIKCNSCQKKFTVPDTAITVSGRLVQCGSCGNKWTAYPIAAEAKTETKQIIQKKKIKKTTRSQKLKKVDKYSEEYLMKKHGLSIDGGKIKKLAKKSESKIINKSKINKSSFGFYAYLVFLIVFIVSFFGVLNLSKNYLISLYPSSEIYIDYLYEVVDILKTITLQLLNQF